MEDHIITQDSVKSCGILSKEDEREKVKDFVYKHFREAKDHSVLMEHGSARNNRTVRNKGHCRVQQGAFFSGKILSFGCSICKDCFTYSPNDLLKHFRIAHRGVLPTYPCDLCGFVTNEFSVLQRHRIEHRNTLVKCELCQDGVQYSLLLLTRHYTMCHSLNGQFTCDWCHFSTVDAGTFVQHIHHHKETSWKCSKCTHVSLSEVAHQNHLKGHSGTFPFTCEICGYGTARNEYLKKHIAVVHKSEKKSVWTAIEDNGAPLNSPASLKLLLKKTSPLSDDSKEDNQMSKVNIHSEIKPNTNDRSLPIVSSDEVHQLSQDTLAKKDSRNGSNNKLETSTVDMVQEAEHSLSSDSGQTSPNGMTVVRVKNKLSLPPNCTTKVIGFKMVDGKKHLVLKVIQASTASDCCAQLDHREFPNSKNSTLDSLQADDIMTVKVKVEEEETLVSNLELSSNDTDVNNHVYGSLISEEHHVTNKFDPDTSPCQETACSKITFKGKLLATNHFVSSNSPSKNSPLENAESVDAVLSHTLATHKQVLVEDSILDTTATEKDNYGSKYLATAFSSSCKDAENVSLPTQEVFTFHNYSKETTSSSPNFGHSSFELSAERVESPQLSLALTESPDGEKVRVETDVEVSRCEQRNSECSSDVEIDGCIAHVEEEENPESVLQDFNIIKIEEDNIPISKPPSNHPSPVVDAVVDEHSDTVTTQQTNIEKNESTGCLGNDDAAKQNKTTLRILQLPEGKQSVLLRTAESRIAVPVHVKAPAGFKLITNSTNPQINVSYMKPADEKRANSGIVLGSNSKIIGVPTGKAAALLTASKQGITSSSNHYLITSDLKRHPLLLPRTLNSTPADKATKTCYVLQRSLPGAQNSPSPGLRLAGTPLSLNSRPLLALPASSAESTGNLQCGRQTFLLRYVSPSKSGLPGFNEETKGKKLVGPCTQSNDSAGNKLFFKIVSPPSSLLSNASPSNAPLLLATRPPTQCFLLSPNNHSGIKKYIALQNSSLNNATKTSILQSPVKVQLSEAEKPILAPRPVRPPSQRKRRRKLLFDELPASSHKVRKLSNKALPEKNSVVQWSPVAKDQERTLRLSPLNSDQQIKWPRRCQPVVVLNHPDVDIPEVASIMKIVQRHRGAVTKVSLSQKTIQALFDLSATRSSTKDKSSQRDCPQPRTVQSLVRERYLLKLKLRRKSRKKYQLVRTVPVLQQPVVFTCWFCGRLFNSQEAWIGHGQRHLLEATRDWNSIV